MDAERKANVSCQGEFTAIDLKCRHWLIGCKIVEHEL